VCQMLLNKGNKKEHHHYILFLLLVFFSFLSMPAGGRQDQAEHEPLTYDVSVSAVLVPVFAIDSKGNPVHDLKQEELELYINGKQVEFLLNRYQFDETLKTDKEASDPDQYKRERRVVFIILDAIFNSLEGFKRGKEIAAKLIKERTSDDHYIVLQLTPTSGLDYIAGPEPGSEELIEKIGKISLKKRLWRDNLFSKKRMPDNITYGTEDPREDPLAQGRFGRMREVNVRMEKMQYMATVKRFGFLLSQFQHAMNTITNPKLVFLISEGVSRSAMESGEVPGEEGSSSGAEITQDSWSVNTFDGTFRAAVQYTGHISNFHLKYLTEVAKSINRGGSVLYTINPKLQQGVLDDNESGEMSLNYVARESGGKYFQGAKVEKVVEDIKQTTAAYYELTFNAGAIKGKEMRLKINCKREGVQVHSLKYAASATPYRKMNKVQKKIFALNVVTGGTWSRMTGTVKQVPFRRFKPKTDEKSQIRLVRFAIPKEMQNRKADLFLIESDPKTNNVKIQVKHKTLKEQEQLQLKLDLSGKMHQFVAFIEPKNAYCIFNRIN
jgi:VWFA-related protein